MQIETIKAGPELDTLIAEEIMEWKTSRDFQGLFFDMKNGRSRIVWKSKAHEFRKLRGIHSDAIGDDWVFSPSEDMAAAWEVIEKLKADGWYISVCWNDTIPKVANYWSCGFWEHGQESRGGLHVGAKAETAPLAICRAALEVVRRTKSWR